MGTSPGQFGLGFPEYGLYPAQYRFRTIRVTASLRASVAGLSLPCSQVPAFREVVEPSRPSALDVALSVAQIQTFWPAAAPIAVRSPYLNVWQTAISTNDYPISWNGSVLGWVGLIRVDGSTYRWLGNNFDMTGSVGAGCNVTFTEVTPTRTIQTVQAGPMNMTLTFLSPIEPSDWVKQSMPFSYLAVEFASTDGKQHDVQLYSDISAEWVSANKGYVAEWSSNQTDNMVYHAIKLQQARAFDEEYQQAADGTAYYAMSLGYGQSVGWQSCQDTVCYETFYGSGALSSKNDNDTFRAIWTDLPVFAFSVDFGSVSGTQSPVVWTVGYVRDPSIEYTLSGDVTTLRPYYTSQYSNAQDVVETFLSDYNDALSRAEALDSQIQSAASEVSSGSQYYNMLSLAARQTYGALDLTTSGGSTRFFMKDIGYSSRVTPVETLYAALPMFLYFNASMVKPFLLPLLEQQNTSYTAQYAARDIGTSYPVVSEPSAEANEGIEQSGNMLIMVLAHATYSSDSTLLQAYYSLLKTWADYLVSNALYPANQLSVDTESTASNSTNLALKGIIGIQAMANISAVLGRDEDAQHYSSVATQYTETWRTLAMPSDSTHIIPTYGDASSAWSLSYNMYAHTLLSLNLLDEKIFTGITTYYQGLFQSGANYTYGLPLDSDHDTLGSPAWMSLTAAALTDTGVRQQMLSHLWEFASSSVTSAPFASRYSVSNGSYIGGTASPAQGALFAPLVLSGNRLNGSQGPPSTGSSSDSSGKHRTLVAAIVGGVVGGVVGLILIALGALFFYRRRRVRTTAIEPYPSPVLPEKDVDATASPSRLLLLRKHSSPVSVTGNTSFIGGTPSSISAPMVTQNAPASVIVLGNPPSVISSDTATSSAPARSVPAPALASPPTPTVYDRSAPTGFAPLSSSSSRPSEPLGAAGSVTVSSPLPSASTGREDPEIQSPDAAPKLSQDRDAELASLRNDMQQLRQELRRVVPVLERLEEPPPDYWSQ
ncbi:uncharacterized protein B0H18DRAFT_1126524 [Fomitopsis serialis]|uniref:uncharacterized protein n=1 Tax=Fomitopsis serialis TaxID=139415 RepID=UPI002007A8D0|nr:uncharacterized protein B0H18DRAFT_1126524 [Neoantrodia serialis]KAH9913165.1 hypothetical protein B0H18DRAFT_1126524 [Neoantrodia serialis]